MDNNFKFVLPAELEKGEDGSYKVKGLASTQKMDQQGETIIQKGVDLTPIDKKRGVLNWDHLKGPENTIGVLDGYKRTDGGLFIEGRLFKNHTKAKAVREIMQSLGDGDRGRMGLSVEGKILKRNAQDPRIIEKCQINAVALTMNPVNADTFADIVKSMSAGEVEFNAQEQSGIEETNDEATFTTTQVMAMVQKALSAGAAGMKAPADRSGGEALAVEDMDKAKEDPCWEGYERTPGTKQGEKGSCRKKKLKKMSKSLYKSNIITILDKLQVLYPDYSRTQIWEAVKDRLDTRFPEVNDVAKGQIRLQNTSAKEREHKLYEEARQRSDYAENKGKTRAQLAEIARESGAEKKEQAKIRAQADAAKQVGERDHVRPGVK